jgi:hypothetical protein
MKIGTAGYFRSSQSRLHVSRSNRRCRQRRIKGLSATVSCSHWAQDSSSTKRRVEPYCQQIAPS